MKLDKKTLEWVLERIKGYQQDEYYDYCSSMESLEIDIEYKIEEMEQ